MKDINLYVLLHSIIHKDWKDIKTFANNNQLDLMIMLVENLQAFELSVGYLRSIMKMNNLHQLLEANQNLRLEFENDMK